MKHLIICVASLIAACGNNSHRGVLVLDASASHLQALTYFSDLHCVRVEITGPDHLTIDWPIDAQQFNLHVPLQNGDYTLEAKGYAEACGAHANNILAEGSGHVTVVPDQNIVAQLPLYDVTGPAPSNAQPIQIVRLDASDTSPIVGEKVLLALEAVDLRGLPLDVAWSQSAECGTFGDVVDGVHKAWTATNTNNGQACVIEATVTDPENGLAKAQVSLNIVASDPTPVGQLTRTQFQNFCQPFADEGKDLLRLECTKKPNCETCQADIGHLTALQLCALEQTYVRRCAQKTVGEATICLHEVSAPLAAALQQSTCAAPNAKLPAPPSCVDFLGCLPVTFN